MGIRQEDNMIDMEIVLTGGNLLTTLSSGTGPNVWRISTPTSTSDMEGESIVLIETPSRERTLLTTVQPRWLTGVSKQQTFQEKKNVCLEFLSTQTNCTGWAT